MEQTVVARQSGKTAQLVHSLLTRIKEQSGPLRIQIETANRLTMEHMTRVVFFTAGFPKYDLVVKEVSLQEKGFILFENGTEVHFSLVVPEEKES
jgi:hypothetical protein